MTRLYSPRVTSRAPNVGAANALLVIARPRVLALGRFNGSIAGNRVDGVFDPASCAGGGTFFLVKQGTTAGPAGPQVPVIGNLVALKGPGSCGPLPAAEGCDSGL